MFRQLLAWLQLQRWLYTEHQIVNCISHPIRQFRIRLERSSIINDRTNRPSSFENLKWMPKQRYARTPCTVGRFYLINIIAKHKQLCSATLLVWLYAPSFALNAPHTRWWNYIYALTIVVAMVIILYWWCVWELTDDIASARNRRISAA